MAILEVMMQEQVSQQLVLGTTGQQNQVLYLSLNKESRELECIQQRSENFFAAMVPVNGRWVLISRPGDSGLFVNQIPVIELKLLDHDDRIAKGDLLLHFVEESTEIVTENSALIQEKKACPVCQGDFEVGEEVIFCPKCGQAHHYSCWKEFGRCASFPPCGYVIAGGSEQTEGTGT